MVMLKLKHRFASESKSGCGLSSTTSNAILMIFGTDE